MEGDSSPSPPSKKIQDVEVMKASKAGLIVAVSLFFLNMFDALMTLRLINLSGKFVEVNPIMVALMGLVGDWFWLPKILVCLPSSILILFYWEKYSTVRIMSMTVTSVYACLGLYHILMAYVY